MTQWLSGSADCKEKYDSVCHCSLFWLTELIKPTGSFRISTNRLIYCATQYLPVIGWEDLNANSGQKLIAKTFRANGPSGSIMVFVDITARFWCGNGGIIRLLLQRIVNYHSGHHTMAQSHCTQWRYGNTIYPELSLLYIQCTSQLSISSWGTKNSIAPSPPPQPLITLHPLYEDLKFGNLARYVW